MESLQWLYKTLTALKYQNLVLIYQDISLILSVNPQTKLSVTSNSQLQLIVGEFTIYFPLDYPQTPPSINPQVNITPLSQWTKLYSADKSNEGIPPQQNRLLQLYISLLQYKQPKIPELPPKPPKPPQLVIKHTQSEKTSEKASPPQLPANPIRISLIDRLKGVINETSRSYLVQNTKDIIEIQNELMMSYKELIETDKYVNDVIKYVNYSNPIIQDKLEQAVKVTNETKQYIESDYNHDENLVTLDEKSIKLADVNAITDTLHFTVLLFNTKKISLTDCIMQTRRLSRNKANILIENADL